MQGGFFANMGIRRLFTKNLSFFLLIFLEKVIRIYISTQGK